MGAIVGSPGVAPARRDRRDLLGGGNGIGFPDRSLGRCLETALDAFDAETSNVGSPHAPPDRLLIEPSQGVIGDSEL